MPLHRVTRPPRKPPQNPKDPLGDNYRGMGVARPISELPDELNPAFAPRAKNPARAQSEYDELKW